MQDSTLVRLLRLLPISDLRNLKKVVRSPYFNTREDVSRLYDYIFDHHAETGATGALDRQRVFRRVFPNEKTFDMAPLRRAMTLLTECVKQFLAIEAMRSSESVEEMFLLQAFQTRGIEEFKEKTLETALAKNERQPRRDADYLSRQSALNWEIFHQTATKKWITQADFEPMLQQNTRFLLVKILQLGCQVAAVGNFLNLHLPAPFLDEAVRLVEQHLDEPAIRIYFHVLQCLRGDESEPHTEILNECLTRYRDQFSKTDLHIFVISVLNVFNTKLSTHPTEDLRKKTFSFYCTALETGLLTPHKVLSKFSYYNIFMIGVQCREFEWTRRFLEDWMPMLPAAERENAFAFHLAAWHFHTKNYDEAMARLQQVATRDEVLYSLEARGMLARIFFERGERDALAYHLDSYRMFVYRHPETGFYKELHLNFIVFLQKIMDLDKTDAARCRQLAAEISGTVKLREKSWLLQLF